MQSKRAPKLDWHIDTLIPNSLALLYLFARTFAGIWKKSVHHFDAIGQVLSVRDPRPWVFGGGAFRRRKGEAHRPMHFRAELLA
jgi:hypothetical protein